MKFNLVSLIFLVLLSSQCRNREKDGMLLVNEQFWMDVSPVTVAQFRVFVKETSYVTEAELFGDGGVFDFKSGGWILEKGANWKYPFGSKGYKAEDTHPVTQVSWNDARAYAKWAGKRLPTSDEFILAEKNGKDKYTNIYTWGSNFIENGKYKANFWQGTFPSNNTQEDGFLTTSPVGHFGKNEIGLTDMGGNVWQWCSDESLSRAGEKNQRGGSYLCDPSVCHGFKVGGEASASAETSLVHVGFRCVRDVK